MRIRFHILRSIPIWSAIVSIATSGCLLGESYETTAPLDDAAVMQAIDPALMCLAIYSDCGVAGWRGPEEAISDYPLLDKVSGLHAGVYWHQRTGTDEAILAFAGTDPTSFDDWRTDLLQAFGGVPEQYVEAVSAAQTLKACARKRGASVRCLVGHSLGGGLATYAALATRLPATCFATAPLGRGAIQSLSNDKIDVSKASLLISHIFVARDPILNIPGIVGGVWPGYTLKPDLAGTSDRTDTGIPSVRLARYLVTGLVLKKHAEQVKTATEVLAGLDRHLMSNYVDSLAVLLEKPGNFNPAGYWRSEKGFFQIGVNRNLFSLQRNGTFSARTEFHILDPAQGLGFHFGDGGTWTYSAGVLTLNFGNFATLTYQLEKALPERLVDWRRTDAQTHDNEFLASLSHKPGDGQANNQSAQATLLLVKGAMLLMKNQPVTWAAVPPEEICKLP